MQIVSRGVVLLLVFALACSALQAAAPADQLARLVPDDVGFCVLVRDLRGQAEALRQSPFIAEFLQSPLGRDILGSPEILKLSKVEQDLKKLFDLDWPQLRDEILGDAVLLAYRPGPPEQPDQEQDLFLLYARKPELLSKLIERMNELQRQGGELKQLEARKHHGREYFRREDVREVKYYFQRGPVFAISGKEDMLRQVLDRDRIPPAASATSVAGRFQNLAAVDSLAAIWINSRAFDAHLQEKVAQAKGAEAIVLKTLHGYWKAFQGSVLSVGVQNEGLEVKLTLQAADKGLPGAIRKLFSSEEKRSDLWDRFPDNALVAMAGRLDAVSLVDFLGEFVGEENRQAWRQGVERGPGAVLGRDPFKEVLPFLGPDWGFCAAAPNAGDGWFPQLLAALRVQAGNKDRPLDRVLWDGLNTFALLAVLGHNGSQPDPVKLESEQQDGVEVRFLVNDKHFPAGLRPAFAFKDGYLLLASSPQAIRRFGAAKTKDPSKLQTAGPWLRLSLQEIGRYLKDRATALAEPIAEKNGISKEEAVRRLDRLAASCQLFDRLELSRQVDGNRFSWVLRLRTGRPLK